MSKINWRAIASGLIVPVAVIALWQLVCVLGWVNPPETAITAVGGTALVAVFVAGRCLHVGSRQLAGLGDIGGAAA